MSQWLPYYAWTPTRLVDGRMAWLRWIEQRAVFWGCSIYGDIDYEYRATPLPTHPQQEKQ